MQISMGTSVITGLPRYLWVLLMAAILAGCAGPALEAYSGRKPVLTPQTFFVGELSARGVVKDFSGEVIRTFDADISASWDSDGVGTLDEEFRFDDGEVQTRVSYGDDSIDVRMDDWMYLITPDTLINQTTMTKWGIEVGEIVLVISKR
ncbi:DUF3833 domain-containing protein [Marinobacter sp. 71-i]|uniref:DUF3833 domain-containing protein n=1 Tax=Marinobacter iranensis TaxID=2962607 RepID=A0ABT5YCQ2_9GAMM|nr:DUF3833 family protein [Marinobacter iranensis]MDF0751455.1 DUF3833 domain-containing protein [Marinobacter iranensis]